MMPADSPALAAIRAELRERAGPDYKLPNLYRVIGIAPQMLRAWLDFAWPLRLEAQSERRLRELMILRGAQVCEVRYEWAHHVPMALQAGVSLEQIRALGSWRQASCFDARERAVLRLAEELSGGPGASESCLAELRVAGFPEDQLVELVLTASFYVCVARFLASMAVELEPGYERYLDAGACRLPQDFAAEA